jgi:hypothetical protein
MYVPLSVFCTPFVCKCVCTTATRCQPNYSYTGLFISPSGISDPCGTAAGMVTQKGSMSTEGETLQVSVLPYRCSICPPLVTRQTSNFGKFQDTDRLLIPCPRHVSSRLPPLAVKPASTPRRLVQKKTWRGSLSIDMLLSAVSVLVVAQSSSDIPEGLMNNPVYIYIYIYTVRCSLGKGR